MNKILKSLIISTFCVCAFSALSATTSCSGTCDYNKTFLSPRSHGTNLALLHGPGICEIINRKDKDKFGGTLQAIFFYQDGDHDGEYWTPADKNSFSLLDSTKLPLFAPISIGATTTSPVFPKFDATDKIKFNPEQDAYGVTLVYDQRLDSLLKGLYFRIQLPIVHVNNDLNMCIEGTNKEALVKFFKGESMGIDYSVDTNVKSFANLTHAKIGGSCSDDDATGIADIDVLLGYTFLNNKDYHASLNIGLTIPTGNDADGKVLNEAIVGNGQHFGLGLGATFDARLWGDKEHNIMMYLELMYRYLFESSEHRTLGLKDIAWGHYLPIFKDAVTADGVVADFTAFEAIPAANVLTQNVDVTPGSVFDGVVTFAYNNGGFGANLGYNLYFREGEDVDLKCGSDENIFEKDKYSYIAGAHSTPASKRATMKLLKKEDLVVKPAETCSQVTHKIFGGISWTFKDWETPVNVGIGAHYEFADGREANEGWGINGRAAIGF